MNKIKYIAAALIAIAGLGFQQAKADTYSFDLNVGNAALTTGGFNGPYATVTVNLTDSTHATITFAAYNGYLIGGAQAAGVNVSGSFQLVANSFSWTGGNASTAFSDGGANNLDGFGSFKQTIDNFDGFNAAVTSLSFKLLATNGNTWGNAMSVLTSTWLAAAHIFAIGDSSILTGYGAGNGVPDGGTTVMLLGIGLGVLGMVRRYLTC